MDVPARKQDADADPDDDLPSSVVTSHETSPGRLVFTEAGNTDGWIATDSTVDLEP